MTDRSYSRGRSNVVLTGKRNLRISSKGFYFVYVAIIILLALNLLVVYGIFSLPNGIMGYTQKRLQVKELEARNRKLNIDIHDLFKKIEKAKSDGLAQERLVREHLGWVKKDEIVVNFVENSQEAP
jgi:cell division protein FtsB